MEAVGWQRPTAFFVFGSIVARRLLDHRRHGAKIRSVGGNVLPPEHREGSPEEFSGPRP